MALIGSSHPRDRSEQLTKLDAIAAMEKPPSIVADLSLAGSGELVSEAVARGFVASSLPVYGVAAHSSGLDALELLDRAVALMELGAGVLTIHPTPTLELVDLARRRLVPWTSRGGGLVIEDLLRRGADSNIYLDILPDLLTHAKRTATTLSIGASFRSANIFDSNDATQAGELVAQIRLADAIRAFGVQVIIESPGHARPRDIIRIAEKLASTGYPIMPLGPIPTDTAIGQDHIAASIGVTIMGLHGAAHVIAAVTREEHTGGIPAIDSTIEALLAANVAAHVIDLDRLDETSLDLEIAKGRAEGASCIHRKATEGCSRCARSCPLPGAARVAGQPTPLSKRVASHEAQ
jgi:phosphomethylpyrimidine synthase